MFALVQIFITEYICTDLYKSDWCRYICTGVYPLYLYIYLYGFVAYVYLYGFVAYVYVYGFVALFFAACTDISRMWLIGTRTSCDRPAQGYLTLE